MSYSGTPKITVLSSPGSSEGRSNRRLYMGLAGGVLAALLIGGGFKLWQHRQASQSAGSATAEATNPDDTATIAATEGQSADFDTPFLAASPTADSAEPNLLQSTAAPNRMPTVAAGRPDPFAPLVTPLRSPSRPTPLPVTAPPPPPRPMTTAPAVPTVSAPARPRPAMPVAATQSLPPLPTVSIPNLPVPPIPGGLPLATASSDAPPNLSGTPTLSAIEQVAVNGVVQIGQQVHVIVTEPGNPSGQRVSQGDTVAGGQVRIKAIDLSSTDPTVVLTYNGQDYYRTVGSGAL